MILGKLDKKMQEFGRIKERRQASTAVTDEELRLGLNNARLDLGVYFNTLQENMREKVLERKVAEEEWQALLFKNGQTVEEPVPLESRKNNQLIKNLFENLLDSVRKGEEKKVQKIWTEIDKMCRPPLKNFLRKWLRFSMPDKARRYNFFIEDAVQMAFFEVNKKLERATEPMSLLFVIAKRRLIDLIREQSEFEYHEQGQEWAELSLEKDIADPEPSPLDEVSAKDLDIFIKNIINSIKSERLRKTALMIYGGENEEKIRAVLGLTVDNFKRRKNRMRQFLQKSLLKSKVFEKNLILLPGERRNLIQKKGGDENVAN